ncbi:MAG TPA: CsbD family protein [Bryobacteraceae bacterium]|nr:CsbD family protein [Bryobacteraceae bacterium]
MSNVITRAVVYKSGGFMNSDRMQGDWKQLKGKVKEKWGRLTDDDLTVINGQTEQLIGKIQERYGIARDEAENQFKAFQSGYSQGKTEAEYHRSTTSGTGSRK